MTLTAYQSDVAHAKICPYCKAGTKVITETEVYGREYKGRKIIACKNFPACDAYVGTHDDGTTLGRLANKELRKAKTNAHNHFDKIWREKYEVRSELYARLSEHLGLPEDYTHIGMFSVLTCQKVAIWSQKLYNEYKSQ